MPARLDGYTAAATDGDIGSVVDFLLDDARWTVRNLVVESGSTFLTSGHRVLVTPISFRSADWDTARFHLTLTRDKVKNCPSVDLDKPVSRQHERDYNRYYGYAPYWGYPNVWGTRAEPCMLARVFAECGSGASRLVRGSPSTQRQGGPRVSHPGQ